MIKTLKIKNFILIDELTLEFESGFNIIAGETGAGKSIIISAIDIVLGNKANRELIKSGKNSSYIELTFKLSENFDLSIFEINGIDLDFGDEIIISREINQTNSKSRINGVIVSSGFLKELSKKIIDIHSQNQTYTYIQPKYHISLLDNFDKENHIKLLNDYKILYKKYENIKNEIKDLDQTNNLTQNQIDFLRFQIDEIEEVNLMDNDEDKNIVEKLNVMLNSEKLKEYTHNAYEILYGGENSIIDSLASVKSYVSKCLDNDNSFSQTYEEIENAYEILRDQSSFIRNYFDNISTDEEKMNILQERLDSINRLKRKYGSTIEEIKNNLEKFKQEFSKIELKDEKTEKLKKELDKINPIIENAALKLSESRKKLAKKLSKIMEIALNKLELPKTKFEIKIENTELSSLGVDEVEFMISTNVSESVKPLIKVASGGEISRIMLAIKTLFAKADNVNTVIFDEIDTGISGKASISVSKALTALSKTHQVICISHQAIIASKAKNIFYVTKTQGIETNINVKKLDENEKLNSIALLASGKINEETLKFAKELITQNS